VQAALQEVRALRERRQQLIDRGAELSAQYYGGTPPSQIRRPGLLKTVVAAVTNAFGHELTAGDRQMLQGVNVSIYDYGRTVQELEAEFAAIETEIAAAEAEYQRALKAARCEAAPGLVARYRDAHRPMADLVEQLLAVADAVTLVDSEIRAEFDEYISGGSIALHLPQGTWRPLGAPLPPEVVRGLLLWARFHKEQLERRVA
jgi:hypothetical protein